MRKLLLALAVSLSAGLAQATLIHHWTFDEGSGDAIDTAGANNATLNGGATWATDGVRGTHISFDGAVGSYLSTGLTYDPDSTFTWALWAKNDNDSKLSAIIMGNRRDGVTGGLGADFVPREFVKITAANTIFRPNNVANSVEYTDLTIAEGWTHLAVVKDGTTVTPYLNGVAGTPVTLTDPFTNNMPVFFGGDNTTRGIEFFQGGIDDARIYDTALSASEVVALIPEPSTLGLMAFVGGLLLMRRRR